MHAGNGAEAVVEKFLWALDKGDTEAARQLVWGHRDSPSLRRGAAYFGPGQRIKRLVFTGNSEWGWDCRWVTVTVGWKEPHTPWPGAEAPWRAAPQTLFGVDEAKPEAWRLSFELERGRWWGAWKIIQAQGGC